jgi:hypothetical protein
MNNQTLDQSIDVLSQALRELASAKNQKYTEQFIEFHAPQGTTNYGKGIIFSGEGHTKQLVLSQNPDRFFFSESIDLGKGKNLSINNVKVLDDKELGASITKSNLREIGRLKGLIVDGPVSINQYMFYDAVTDRLGLGTDQPHAALALAENGIEVIIGTNDSNKGFIGTYSSVDFEIVTDNTSRITVKGNGDIDFGNLNRAPVKVGINGKLSVNVRVPDPAVDLHIAGPVRIHNRLQMYADAPPTIGNYNCGDIVWNSTPRQRGHVGWICTKDGSPGLWNPFGEIR